MTDLKSIQKDVYREYIKNGYLKRWNNKENSKIFDIAELGLICTEISETMEELRIFNTNYNNVGIECADIIIRTLNFMSRRGLDAEFYINYKHKKNMEREKLHGKEV